MKVARMGFKVVWITQNTPPLKWKAVLTSSVPSLIYSDIRNFVDEDDPTANPSHRCCVY